MRKRREIWKKRIRGVGCVEAKHIMECKVARENIKSVWVKGIDQWKGDCKGRELSEELVRCLRGDGGLEFSKNRFFFFFFDISKV